MRCEKCELVFAASIWLGVLTGFVFTLCFTQGVISYRLWPYLGFVLPAFIVILPPLLTIAHHLRRKSKNRHEA